MGAKEKTLDRLMGKAWVGTTVSFISRAAASSPASAARRESWPARSLK